nr:MAG TPA: hypothetical protein [Caudoviricetes sp.]
MTTAHRYSLNIPSLEQFKEHRYYSTVTVRRARYRRKPARRSAAYRPARAHARKP